MTALIRAQLATLARTVAELKGRVREAVAGELGRTVGGAVQQVVQALVTGPPRHAPTPPHRPAPGRAWDDDEGEHARWGSARDPWADDEDDGGGGRHAAPVRSDAPAAAAGLTTAVAAGVCAARWWLGRQGTLLAAAGLGLGVGLLGVLGGPVARAAVAVVAAAADILGAADALGAGAARLGHA